MAFTLEHVQQVRNGHPRQVGTLPDTVWKSLGWKCPWVYLGQSGLDHIAKRHPDVTDFDLLWLPLAIASGAIVTVTKNPRLVLVGYHAEGNRFYMSALKEAQLTTEIWVSSFYRAKQEKVTRIERKGRLLRRHL